MQIFDLKGDVVNNMIQVGDENYRRNQSVIIKNYMRNAGTMGDNVDINIVNSRDTIIENAHGHKAKATCVISHDKKSGVTVNNPNRYTKVIEL